MLKFFTWETPFLQKTNELRDREVKQIFRRSIIQAFVSTIIFAVPVLCSALAFIVYGILNSGLDPSRVFSALAWFNLLRFPLMFLPNVIVGSAEFKIATGRIQELLFAPELEQVVEKLGPDAPNAVEVVQADFMWEVSEEKARPSAPSEKSPITVVPVVPAAVVADEAAAAAADAVAAIDGTATSPAPTAEADFLPEAKADVTLKHIDFAIPKGTLVGICGAVGSGKSSLLNALIGEMKRTCGSVRLAGKVGYASQQAWIQNASVRDNILFGLPMDRDRYQHAIKVCSLEKDLEILPDRDLTQIGERGINLSGGQKQRINLARIVYYDCDVVLLDDPLSAVDAHVGRALFEECILGALKGKTVILVTHQLHFLPRVDRIITMKGGQLAEQGSYEELMARQRDFFELMRDYGGVERGQAKEGEAEAAAAIAAVMDADPLLATPVGGSVVAVTGAEGTGAVTKAKRRSDKGGAKPAKTLMTAEERAVGAVSSGVYASYFGASGGPAFIAGIAFFLTLYQVMRVGSDYWLVVWSNNRIPALSQPTYIGIYVAWAIGQSLSTYAFGVFVAYSGTRASRVLHSRALERVLRAPVLFFDTNPLGRIINRFSKDQDVVDNSLTESLRMFATTAATSLTTFGLIIYTTPLFAAPLAPALVVYYFAQKLYRATSRELKRLDALCRSPLYAQVGETMTGLSTIRAYEDQPRFILTNQRYLDESNEPYFLQLVAQRWLGVRLESMGSLLVFFAALFGVLQIQQGGGFSSALFGLSLSYALSVTGVLNWCVRQFAESENAMNAVERLDHYGKAIAVEAPAILPDHRPPPGWPSAGAIEVEGLEMRYDTDLPLVLMGVSFAVASKERIGIVGRTGSGKSSIMQALFRMVEHAGGHIWIDGVDISTIGLADLRSGLSIIPQGRSACVCACFRRWASFWAHVPHPLSPHLHTPCTPQIPSSSRAASVGTWTRWGSTRTRSCGTPLSAPTSRPRWWRWAMASTAPSRRAGRTCPWASGSWFAWPGPCSSAPRSW